MLLCSKFKERRGLCRLALECNTEIIPIYIFGANDFYHNLFSGDSFVNKFCRRMKIGMTYFWGRFYLPIPLSPRITMAVGRSLPMPKYKLDDDGNIPEQVINQYHEKYLSEMQTLFDKYKEAAGYVDAKLEIL